MKINIYAVGQIKDLWLKKIIDDYVRRIGAFAPISIIEIKDLPINNDEKIVIKKESAQLLKRLAPGYTIAMCIEGRQMDSLAFAGQLEKCLVNGCGALNIIIGGSLGLSSEIKKRADLLLSLGSMTFLHNHARLLILEQIYRAFKINNNQKYHK